MTVADPGSVDEIWTKALTAGRPVVLDVKADPNVIALPPHVDFEQTRNFFMALAKGDADREGILANLVRQWAA